jgi:hypothetical protein
MKLFSGCERCQHNVGTWWKAVAPESSAKVYWNKENVVYVDAAGLPEPQRNGVSGLGSKIKSLTPTSRIIEQI